jgi:elongation factor P
MIEAGDLRKGVTLRLDGNLYRVMNTVYNKPGRGTASMRTTLLSLSTWQNSERIFRADEKLDNVYVESQEVEYLYNDGDHLHFMDNGNYEQYEAPISLFGDDVHYLKDNLVLELRLLDGQAIDYALPTTVTYKVADAEVAVAGDTAGNVMKKATTESGLEIQVPLFVNVGDTIKVDTRDGSYVGRG